MNTLTIGKRIREARKNHGLSQLEIAKHLGVSQSSIVFWETEKAYPRNTALNALAKLLMVSPQYLEYGSAGEAPRKSIEIVGEFTAKGEIQFFEPEKREISGILVDFPGMSPNAAIQVTNNSLFPFYSKGELILFELNTSIEASEYIGNDCVVKIVDGPIVVKRLLSGTKAKLLTLSFPETTELVNVDVEWAYPILAVQKFIKIKK